MRELVLRLVLLMILVGSLIALPTNQTVGKASASECCAQCCADGYQACVDACPPRGQPGHFSCIGQCNLDWQWCPNVCAPGR